MPGHPDWMGTALVHGADNIFTDLTISIPPGVQTTSTKTYQISKPGYLIHYGANYGGTTPTNPLVTCEPYWYDPTEVWYMGHERWTIPAELSNLGYYKAIGTGPTKGNYIQLVFSNADPTVTAQAVVTLVETTQHLARDDWRVLPEPGSSLPVYTLLPDPYYAAGNYLANAEVTVAESTTDSWILPLYAGQVAVTIQPVNATSGQNWSLVDALTGVTAYAGSATAAAPTNSALAVLGRHPYLLEIDNTSSTGANSSRVMIVALEYST